MLRYGVELPVGAVCADPRVLAEFAAAAERAGWDGVFLEDYIVYGTQPDCPTCDPWIALAAMALATERVRLGTTVTAPSRRRPWKLAREAVTLDHLSGGRLTLGVGLGDPTDAGFSQVSEETDDWARAQRLDESLEILAGLWSGERFSFTGAHYDVRDVRFLPTPVQSPGVPVWVGGGFNRPAVLRRAVRQSGIVPYKPSRADPYQDADEGLSAAEVAGIRDFVERERGSADGFDIVLGGRRRGPDWDAERRHIRSVAEAGATWWGEWVPPGPLEQMRQAVEAGPLTV